MNRANKNTQSIGGNNEYYNWIPSRYSYTAMGDISTHIRLGGTFITECMDSPWIPDGILCKVVYNTKSF